VRPLLVQPHGPHRDEPCSGTQTRTGPGAPRAWGGRDAVRAHQRRPRRRGQGRHRAAADQAPDRRHGARAVLAARGLRVSLGRGLGRPMLPGQRPERGCIEYKRASCSANLVSSPAGHVVRRAPRRAHGGLLQPRQGAAKPHHNTATRGQEIAAATPSASPPSASTLAPPPSRPRSRSLPSRPRCTARAAATPGRSAASSASSRRPRPRSTPRARWPRCAREGPCAAAPAPASLLWFLGYCTAARQLAN
jgi:hypothetical protein